MRQRPKPVKAKVPVAPQTPKDEDAKVRDLERRLAEALQREAEALAREAVPQGQQAATAEILRVISSSPSDAQPVFEAIARNAARLCDAMLSVVFSFDGTRLHFVAGHQLNEEASRLLQEQYPLVPRGLNRLALVDRAVVHSPDVLDDPRVANLGLIRRLGYRSHLVVPMVHAGQAIGVINIYRAQPAPFADAQIALLETFADQAVIAIENVRLFKELDARNRDLSQALQQQTATAEILRVISSSPTDLQPVFDMIVRNAATLCGAAFGGLHRVESGRITFDAQYGVPADELQILQHEVFPLAISRGSATGRAVLDRGVVHIHDIREDPEFRTPRLRTMQSYRTILAVPMMREGVPIGTVACWSSVSRLLGES